MKIYITEKNNLPPMLENDNMYIATSTNEKDFSEIIFNNKKWASIEYIDMKLEKLEKLLEQI